MEISSLPKNSSSLKFSKHNARQEQYYECDVVINGTTFKQVGIRPKNNTSLSSIHTEQQKQAAIEHYYANGRNLKQTSIALGYVTRDRLRTHSTRAMMSA